MCSKIAKISGDENSGCIICGNKHNKQNLRIIIYKCLRPICVECTKIMIRFMKHTGMEQYMDLYNFVDVLEFTDFFDKRQWNIWENIYPQIYNKDWDSMIRKQNRDIYSDSKSDSDTGPDEHNYNPMTIYYDDFWDYDWYYDMDYYPDRFSSRYCGLCYRKKKYWDHQNFYFNSSKIVIDWFTKRRCRLNYSYLMCSRLCKSVAKELQKSIQIKLDIYNQQRDMLWDANYEHDKIIDLEKSEWTEMITESNFLYSKTAQIYMRHPTIAITNINTDEEILRGQLYNDEQNDLGGVIRQCRVITQFDFLDTIRRFHIQEDRYREQIEEEELALREGIELPLLCLF